MEVPVYTSALRIERRWRHYGKIPLPFGPYTAWQQVVYGVVFFTLVTICRILGIGPDLMVAVAVLGLPWLAQWRLARPKSDGMPAHIWALGWLQYWTSPKVIVQHQAAWNDQVVHVALRVWRPLAEARPAAATESVPTVDWEPVPGPAPAASAEPRPTPAFVSPEWKPATTALVPVQSRQVLTIAAQPVAGNNYYLAQLDARRTPRLYVGPPRRELLHLALKMVVWSLAIAISISGIAIVAMPHLPGGAR